MIKVKNIDVWGFEHAIRGMRNPMNSWDKSDSEKKGINTWMSMNAAMTRSGYEIGPNDLNLMRRLYKAGTSHRKYLRQIFVSMDITAPLYFWKEMDQYRINVTSNSCSSMHTIHKKEFELDDFSHEHLRYEYSDGDGSFDLATWAEVSLLNTIETLNRARDLYLKSKDKKHWWLMIQLLPSSYNQKRTVTMNYENVINIISQRSNHKLDEWHEFCDTLRDLPYIKEIMEESNE